ncbi:hypothetical protein JKF63_07142 [Porcisia hertigi]|uniref:YEATS domain-containing protein n=1 Tax=Porcisia hertigi TaxID=2761500 RepID=A0A836YG87_9TRYP|nr:hypothetical protein JKF63_07142 [Porcisia hertigi]
MFGPLPNGREGSSKSVELHVDGRVSHVSLHAAAHATVADLLSTAVAASSPTFPAVALTPRELAKGFVCTDTAGTRIDLSALAVSVPPQLVVAHTGTAGSVGASHAIAVSIGTGRRGGRGSSTARSASSPGRGRARGRGRGRGRGWGRGRAAAVAKARVTADTDDDDDSDGDSHTEGFEGTEEVESGSALGVATSEGAAAEDEESRGGKSNDDSEGYSSQDDSDSEDGEDEEEDGDDVDSFAATASTRTTSTRVRRVSSVATTGSGRGRGRGRSSGGRGAGRTSAASLRSSLAPITPAAVNVAVAPTTRSRSASASPLLFTPDGQLIKRKRGRPPKSQQLAFAAAAAAVAAAAAAAADAVTASGRVSNTATGERPLRQTRRSAKEEVPAEEVKPRRGGRRRRSDAEVEVLGEQQRVGAACIPMSGDAAALAVAPGDSSMGTVGGSGRRGGLRRGLVDAAKKRSRSSSPSSQSTGSSSLVSTVAQSLAAPAVTVVAVGTTGGGCASLLVPGTFRTLAGAAAEDSAAAPIVPRARTISAPEQQKPPPPPGLKAQEEQELSLRQQRRRVRLTYNSFYPSPPLHHAAGATSCTGGGGGFGARSHQAHNNTSSSPLLEDPSVPALRPRYVWNGRDRQQHHSWSSAAPLLPLDDVRHGTHSMPATTSDAWVTLSSLLSSVTKHRGSPSATSASATTFPSHETRAAQLHAHAKQIVSSWRVEQHRTPSLLLSHPYSPLFMPGLRVYQPPPALLASPPAPLAAQTDAHSTEPSNDRRAGVKIETKDEQGDVELNNKHRCAQPTFSPPASGPSAEEGHTSRLHCYPNQTLIVPVVVGGCVQLVNPESKDKSHQWTVYVRGLWNGHPEEVAGSNVRPPSLSHEQPPKAFPSSPSLALPAHSSHQRAGLGDAIAATAAADRGSGGGGGGGGTAAAAAGPASDSQTSLLSASIASPDDYLSDFIEKVVFVLDESFVPCVRTVSSAPFELTEVGWGEFIVSIHVYLKVPAHTRASRRMQGKLLEYYCGFNGCTAMQTCDGRGTKPHDPVSTYVTGGVRGPSHLRNALTTPQPTTSGTIPPTPAQPLHELRHRFHYDSLLDINSNSGARATYYRGPYLPLHLATCNAASSSSASMQSSSDSDVDGGGSDDAGGRSGSEVSICGGSPTSSTRASLFPSKSELSGDGSPSSSRSGSVTPSPVPAFQHHVSSSSQHQEARLGVSDTACTSGSGSIADGLPFTGVAAGVASASPPNAHHCHPPLQGPPVRRGPGRRPRRFGASRAGSRTPGSFATPGSPAAVGGSGGAHRPLTEVHVGHGSNVVVLQHLLRFSHRPRYPPAIPPAHDPRTQGLHPELLGYTMVAEPVVTEQYDELVIPLEPYVALSTRRRCRASRRRRTRRQEGWELPLKGYNAASLQAQLRHLLAALSVLESRLRTTLRRQLSLMCDDSALQSSYALPPLTNSEAKALGHPGGISCWPHVLDYGNGIERDTSYTAAYLASIATSAEMEGWLSQALEARRAALLGSPAASCAWVTALDGAEEPQLQHSGESPRGQRTPAESREAPANHPPGEVAIASPSSGIALTGTWMAAVEYDLASALLRISSGATVATARDVFFQVVMPHADDIGAVIWCALQEGIPSAVSPDGGLSRTSTLKEEGGEGEGGGGEKKGDARLRPAPVRVASGYHGPSSASPETTALIRGYPLCSVRPVDTGILALRSSLGSNSGSGPVSAVHYPSPEAHMPSLLRDGQNCSSFGHDGDVGQLLSWKAALESAIDAMRIEAAHRQATAVMEGL